MVDADQDWLAAMDNKDQAGMDAAKERKAQAAAAYATAQQSDGGAGERYRQASAAARAQFVVAQAAALEEKEKAMRAVTHLERERLKAAELKAEQNEEYQSALAAYETARTQAGNAYIAAYQNPTPDTHRDTAGYSRAVVLKVAIHERQLCPE